jgi:hypothetical protein
MTTGLVLGGAGIAMIIVGSIKLARTRQVLVLDDGPGLKPWFAALPGGGAAGIIGRF